MRPLLAAKCEDIEKLRYPVLATPKIDGIRCLCTKEGPLTRSLKEIPNRHIFNVLNKSLFEGFDGELVVGDTFQKCTSGIMSRGGTPMFTYWVFDMWNAEYTAYNRRMELLEARMAHIRDTVGEQPFIKVLWPVRLDDPDDLRQYNEDALLRGFEGVMVRDPRGQYKHGRSTFREGILIKIKPFEDDEAQVIDLEELMHNDNDPMINSLGYMERSTHQENMVRSGMLGSLVVLHPEFGKFNVGTGFTEEDRKKIWRNPKDYLGMMAKFRYQKIGMKEKPRCPVFMGWRDPLDM